MPLEPTRLPSVTIRVFKLSNSLCLANNTPTTNTKRRVQNRKAANTHNDINSLSIETTSRHRYAATYNNNVTKSETNENTRPDKYNLLINLPESNVSTA